MAQKKLPHIFINEFSQRFDYTSPRSGGGKPNIPERTNRMAHGRFLSKTFKKLWKVAEEKNTKITTQGFSA